ncbi:regulator sip5 [Zalerion maritima]|uniref:Regulator sip5 n=1 Tax=Zalerion maritima TaxID=339359 RepID=A0AAD5RPB1_9PEZI|nr:regulator sip5 [Zalerion maritima]
MGQKESKLQAAGEQPRPGDSSAGPSGSSGRHGRHQSSNRNRLSRADLGGILQVGISGGSSQQQDPPYERRETRQEREARKRERERLLREKERERSIKEEHVDGGYLVTLGTYIGPEDFSKPAVRQFQIERRLAPFWRGLNDVDSNWTEHQIIAAARGLPIPKADEPPPEELRPKPRPQQSPTGASGSNLQTLTVPIGPRSVSQASDHSGSNPGSALPSPSTTTHISSIKAKGKALATTLKPSSRNASQIDISTPREINLPHDPFVNGQPLELFLYKDATECPICFLSYPPYLNRTRCCDQPICTECFVQIKRPDPHLPEHHDDELESPEPGSESQLISEPAQCPYCQTPEFGVTYDPPSFRRGLGYAASAGGSMNASSSSLSGIGTPSSPPATTRRRAQSLAANAPGVITTDKVRPDWFAKLEAQRNQQARRAAAATALHTATYLMGTSESRSIFGRSSRISRRQASSSPANGSNSNEANPSNSPTPPARRQPSPSPDPAPPTRAPGRVGFFDARRVEDLEELMMAEAVRLSLADEEERRKKAAKEAKKEVKKKEDEEKQARKSEKRSEPSSSGPASSPTPQLKYGNGVASNLGIEANVANAADAANDEASSNSSSSIPDKGKAVDRALSNEASNGATFNAGSSATAGSLPIHVAGSHQAREPSHLRQMSNASSVSSSVAGSAPGSYTKPDSGDPRSSALSVGDEGQADGGNTPNEPMFNFRSLAEMVGVQIEGQDAGRAPTNSEEDIVPSQSSPPVGESSAKNAETTSLESPARTSSDSKSDTQQVSNVPPEVIVTPMTPAPDEANPDAKRLSDSRSVISRHVEIMQ